MISPRVLGYKTISTLLMLGTISACTGPVGAGYERMVSTAGITSTLGGSAVVGPINTPPIEFASAESVAVTGSLTHDTGRLELDDGTYLFIDTDGAVASGAFSDAAGANGAFGAYFSEGGTIGAYDYVLPYALSYVVNGNTYNAFGVAGIITSAADMPTTGVATYAGDASAQFISTATTPVSDNIYYSNGQSYLEVDFATGTANILLGNFVTIGTGGGWSLTPATAPFDELFGFELAIDGAHITGGNWVTLSDGVVVSVVGATPVTTSNGTFFGYDSSISAPDEVGGVVSIVGLTGYVAGIYMAD